MKFKSSRSTKAKVVVPATFLPSSHVVVYNKQNSSFQNWEVSWIPQKYKARQVLKKEKQHKFSKKNLPSKYTYY